MVYWVSRHCKKRKSWKDFQIAVDRLNAPDLVAYYLRHNFQYERTYYPQRSINTIKTGKGDCKAYAIVAYDCLKSAGHNVFILSMAYNTPTGHSVCVPDRGKELFSLDNTRGLSGPFGSEDEIIITFGFEGEESTREYGYAHMVSRFR